MDSEECRTIILANAREVSDALIEAYRPSVDKARTSERRAELQRQLNVDHERAMAPFVKLLAELPPEPMVIAHNPSASNTLSGD
jgi:hypothetical protein